MKKGEYRDIKHTIQTKMGDQLKGMLWNAIRKYVYIGIGILMCCAIIGCAVIEVIGAHSSGGNSSGGSYGNFGSSSTQLEGMDLYNADGSVNEEAIQALENKMTTEYVGLTSTGTATHHDYSKVADWLQDGLIFQCPWWAVGRANYFLEQIGSDKRLQSGNGKDVISNSANVANFTVGNEPRPNSIICWGAKSSNPYGHIAYVEAVDKDGTIYISHAGGGESWFGITTIEKGSYDCWEMPCLGFMYLTDEEFQIANTQSESDVTMLVNAYNELPESKYGPSAGDPSNLTEVEGYEMYSECAAQYKKLKEDAKSEGINMWICSAYRSYSSQNTKFQNANVDIKTTASYYQGPLSSEHRTGLAIDFGSVVDGSTGNWSSWLSNSSHKAMFNWLYQHAHEYGFILRYPKGSESITGIMAESWHFRYIGVEHAKKFKEKSKAYEKTENGITYSTYTYEEYHKAVFGTGNYFTGYKVNN